MGATRKKQRTDAHRAAAYREAGHAVAAWDGAVLLMPVSIFANGRGAGRNVWNHALRNVDFDWIRSADSRRLVERLATVVIAGVVAQRIFAGKEPRDAVCKKRIAEAGRLLEAIPGATGGRKVRLEGVEARVRRFFARKEVRRAVTALGERLLEAGTLAGHEAEEIIERHMSPGR
ncbi:MAG: hypothetical protein ACE5EO_02705 [Candidatus Krumholzibacteriia bacterium]